MVGCKNIVVILNLVFGFSILCVNADNDTLGITPADFTWTFASTVKDCDSDANPLSAITCFFLTSQAACVRHDSADRKGCPVMVSIAPETTYNGNSTFMFRIIGPLTADKPRWAGVGLKRSDLPADSHMDNALAFVCIRGRHEGNDVLRYQLFYTKRGGVLYLPNEDEVENAMQDSFKIAMIDGRMFCEFHLLLKFTVTLPLESSHSGSVDFDLENDIYHILIGNGEYDIEDVDSPVKKHPDHDARRLIEFFSLQKSDCGRWKMCLGKGLDGCKDKRNCHIFARVAPYCFSYKRRLCASPSALLGLSIELATKKGNIIFIGFADTEERSYKLNRVPFFITCERDSPTSKQEVLIRINSCFGQKDLTTDCYAYIPGAPVPISSNTGFSSTANPPASTPSSPILSDLVFDQISRVRFDTAGVQKKNAGWLTCAFRFKADGLQIRSDFVGINYTHGKYYTVVGSMESDIGVGSTVDYMPIPELVVTRGAHSLMDVSRSDFQFDLDDEEYDDRIPNSLNPTDPDSGNKRMADIFGIIASMTFIFAFTCYYDFL